MKSISLVDQCIEKFIKGGLKRNQGGEAEGTSQVA